MIQGYQNLAQMIKQLNRRNFSVFLFVCLCHVAISQNQAPASKLTLNGRQILTQKYPFAIPTSQNPPKPFNLNVGRPQPGGVATPVAPVMNPPVPAPPVNKFQTEADAILQNKTLGQVKTSQLFVNFGEKNQNGNYYLNGTSCVKIQDKQNNNSIYEITGEQLQQALLYFKQKQLAQKQEQKNLPLYCPSKTWQDNNKVKLKQKRFTLLNTRYRYKLYVDGFDNFITKYLYENGTWDVGNMYILGRIIQPNFKVLELGTQCGVQAVMIGQILNSQGHMYLFQPYSISNKILSMNIELNSLTNITTIYPYGASDHSYKTPLFISYENTGASTILSDSFIYKKNQVYKEQIDLRTVDSVIPNDTVIDLAVIDVERIQVLALKGMKAAIERSPNMILIIQWNNQGSKDEARKMAQEFANKGYRFYLYNHGREWCKMGQFVQINMAQLLSRKYGDTWFFPKGIDPPK